MRISPKIKIRERAHYTFAQFWTPPKNDYVIWEVRTLIGLRGTCALARLVMCHWVLKWKEMLTRNRVRIVEYMRYMDDGRAFLSPLKPCWR